MDSYRTLIAAAPKDMAYKNAQFRARLPAGRLYTASHYWLEPTGDSNEWRIGMTRFATRMMGEMVEMDLEVKEHDPLQTGQIIGWMEGFKATTDIYSVIDGEFSGTNPDVVKDPAYVHGDSHGRGWLYLACGNPEPGAMNIDGYAKVLDAAIEKILGEGYIDQA
jgi:glycine cleavage system H protein